MFINPFLLQMALYGRYYFHTHFADEAGEARRVDGLASQSVLVTITWGLPSELLRTAVEERPFLCVPCLSLILTGPVT